MNQKPVKITALSVEELAQLLSQAGRKAISEQDVLAIAEFDKELYKKRSPIESVFSQTKQLLGSALRGRTKVSQKRECLYQVLTHNLMILRCG
jgi:transposase